MTTAQARAKLDRALRRLRSEQGRVARRNARSDFASAMRALHRAVDEEYPPIRRERSPAEEFDKAVRRVMTPTQRGIALAKRLEERKGRLAEDGWVEITHSTARLADCALAGVRVRRGPNSSLWVRAWVLDVPFGDGAVKLLREARGSARKQQAIRSVALLREASKTAQYGGAKFKKFNMASMPMPFRDFT